MKMLHCDPNALLCSILHATTQQQIHCRHLMWATHLADKLHNLVEIVLLLQDLAHDLADVDKIGVKLVIEGLQ